MEKIKPIDIIACPVDECRIIKTHFEFDQFVDKTSFNIEYSLDIVKLVSFQDGESFDCREGKPINLNWDETEVEWKATGVNERR